MEQKSAVMLSVVCAATVWREKGRHPVTHEWITVIHYEACQILWLLN